MKNRNTEAYDGKIPNLSFIRDELDFEVMGYTPEQIAELWIDLIPKKSRHDITCELLFGTAAIIEEGQTFDVYPVDDKNSLETYISWKGYDKSVDPITSSSGSPSIFIHDEIGHWDGQQKTVNNTKK